MGGVKLSSEGYFDLLTKVMKENEEYLSKNAENTCFEVVELINDGVDVKRTVSQENFVKSSISFFSHTLLMSYSSAIYTDLITGNLPACFMELRLMLESLAKSYCADLRYPNEPFFKTKLELLEKKMNEKNVSISKLMKNLGKETGLKNNPLMMWGKLSQEWVHSIGIVKGIDDQIIKKSTPPPYALVIPMNYSEDDLDNINKLGKRISEFRNLLKIVLERQRGIIKIKNKPKED